MLKFKSSPAVIEMFLGFQRIFDFTKRAIYKP
jgi:hypothetical protein